MDKLPRIAEVAPLSDKRLRVLFNNGRTKTYDCKQLLERPDFRFLKDELLFISVKVDGGGYGISWNDNIDISEYELWTNGIEVNSTEETSV